LSLNDQLLVALSVYGLPVLFGTSLINSIGIPIPNAILLIAAGSYIQLGDLNQGWVIAIAVVGAILGDTVGYGIGYWGGRPLVQRLGRWIGGEQRLAAAENLARRWGGFGIFFSRWLLTTLEAWINLASGITCYPYLRFLFWDVAGEVLWVVIFVMLGRIFSDRVQGVIQLLGNLVWVEVGLIGVVIFGWILYRNLRKKGH
jgi:membrane protein DedA with SNARE-associated domain